MKSHQRPVEITSKRLSASIKFALAAGAMALFGVNGAALAANGQLLAQSSSSSEQTQKAKPKSVTLQTIEVTGTHIVGAEIATSNPVTTIDEAQIKATGKATLGAIVQQLPAITGGIQTANTDFGGGSGATFVGLRGLGASRTLVLIDGQRVQGSKFNSVNLNSIPAAAIQSIQVLKDGASAIYGSSAIGGVINVILKREFNGAEFSTNYGISSDGDGQQRGDSFMLGSTNAKGSIFGGVAYQSFNQVTGSARSLTKAFQVLTPGPNGAQVEVPGASGLVGVNPLVFVTVPPSVAARAGCSTGQQLVLKQSAWSAGTSPTTLGDYRCALPTDSYDDYAALTMVTPVSRLDVFVRGIYHLTSHIDAYFTLLHDRSRAYVDSWPPQFGTATSPGVAVSSQSYYNPFGVDFTHDNGNAFNVMIPGRGFVQDHNNTKTTYMFAGVRGDTGLFGHTWIWNAGIDYSSVTSNFIQTDIYAQAPHDLGAGPSFLNSSGGVQCGTPSSPIALSECTPWDPFNTNTASSRAAFAGPQTVVNNTGFNRTRILHFDVSGGLFRLPAGTMRMAAGVLYRQVGQSGTTNPATLLDPSTGTCLISASCASAPLDAGFNVKTAYGELSIPIAKDLPGIHALSVSLGDRYSRYSDFGSTNNWKVGLAYRPIQSLLLRGTVATSFRAPTLGDEFRGASFIGASLINDPCNFVAPTPSSPNPNADNPACVGVPRTGTFINSAVATHTNFTGESAGAQVAGFALKPEEGKSFDFGAVYSPSFVSGLTLSADVWRIYVNNLLTSVPAQTELTLCFDGDTRFCGQIHRFPNGPSQGQVNLIVSPTVNLGRLDVKGTDLSARYVLPTDRFGRFTVSVLGTYLSQFKSDTAPGTQFNVTSNGAGLMATSGSAIGGACPEADGGLCYLPRVRGRGSLNWQRGAWSAQWTIRFLGRFGIPGATGDQVGVDRYGATTYSDLMASYDFSRIRTRVSAGIDDVFNHQPPDLYNYTYEFNTDTQDFDILGRYFWVRGSVRF